MPTEVVVALISALGVVAAGVLPAIFIQQARKENATDHAKVRITLRRIEQKLTQHLEDHANGHFRRSETEAESTRNSN